MTVQALIEAALVAIGELHPGQSASPEESAQALIVANDLLEAWSTLHRRVFVIDNVQFPLTSGKGFYSLGPGGDFEIYRPVKIEKANTVRYDSGDLIGLVKPLELIDSAQQADIAEKGMEAKQPLKLYSDNDYPLIHLHLWPIPLCP